MSLPPHKSAHRDDSRSALAAAWSAVRPRLNNTITFPNQWVHLMALLGYAAEMRELLARRTAADARLAGYLMLLQADPTVSDAIEETLPQVDVDLREIARLRLCRAYLTQERWEDATRHIEQMSSATTRAEALQAMAWRCSRTGRYACALQTYDGITSLGVKLRLLRRWSVQEPQWQVLDALRRDAERAIWQLQDRRDSIALLQQMSRVWHATQHLQKCQQALWYALTYVQELPEPHLRWRRLCDIAVTYTRCAAPDRAQLIFARVQADITQATDNDASATAQVYCYQQQMTAGFYAPVLKRLPHLDDAAAQQHLQRCLIRAWIDDDQLERARDYLPQIHDTLTRDRMMVEVACGYANAQQASAARRLFAPVLRRYVLQLDAVPEDDA